MVALRLALVPVLVALGLIATMGSAAAAPAPGSAVCVTADAALAQGDIEKARDAYVGVIASDPAAVCATQGLARVEAAVQAEKRLCKEGDELAKAGMKEQAQRRYVAALAQNSSSACAIKGLGGGGGKSDDSKKSGVETAEGNVTAVGKIAATVIVGALVALGFLFMLLVFWRRRKPSLSIEAFGDDAVDAKVGGLVAGLVQKRLVELSRRGGRASDGYQLDVVVADVELLAGNESLKETLGGLGETSQLALVVALLGLVDKLWGKHYLVKGDLAPAGGEGPGVVLALQSQKKGLQAQGAIWAPPPPAAKAEPAELDEDEDPQVEAEEKKDAKDDDPTPFYGLAGQASAWVQYEAARSLDRRVEVITKSAVSFSLMSQGLAAQREGNLGAAAELYVEALAADRENVAALVNLSVIFARYEGLYLASVLLLIKASGVLVSHYEVTGE